VQEYGAILAVAIALSYLIVRAVKRRGNNCCGEKECPAAKQMIDRLLAKTGLQESGLPESGLPESGLPKSELPKSGSKVISSRDLHSR
jgi:hypothetical protein